MFKNTTKLLITFLLSTLLITFNAVAFHISPEEHGHHYLEIDHEDGIKKSNLQSKYCTKNVEQNKPTTSKPN